MIDIYCDCAANQFCVTELWDGSRLVRVQRGQGTFKTGGLMSCTGCPTRPNNYVDWAEGSCAFVWDRYRCYVDPATLCGPVPFDSSVPMASRVASYQPAAGAATSLDRYALGSSVSYLVADDFLCYDFWREHVTPGTVTYCGRHQPGCGQSGAPVVRTCQMLNGTPRWSNGANGLLSVSYCGCFGCQCDRLPFSTYVANTRHLKHETYQRANNGEPSIHPIWGFPPGSIVTYQVDLICACCSDHQKELYADGGNSGEAYGWNANLVTRICRLDPASGKTFWQDENGRSLINIQYCLPYWSWICNAQEGCS